MREEAEANRPQVPQLPEVFDTPRTPPAGNGGIPIDSLFDDAPIFPEVDEQVPPASPRPSPLHVPVPANGNG
jgi:hypothetical protein